MSGDEFFQLAHAARLVNSETLYFQIVPEWEAKRQILLLQLSDFPALLQAHKSRAMHPHPDNPRVFQVDLTPTVRLANACEATAHGLYAMAEVAAHFANKVSRCAYKASFNCIRKKCEKDPLSPLAEVLGDLQWYRKIREMRTEWTHYSSTFIAENDAGVPLVCVRAYRRPTDRQEFDAPIFMCTLPEFVSWVQSAIETIDSLAGFLLRTYVLPLFNLDEVVAVPRINEDGSPILTEDNRFEVRHVSVGEFLAAGGIVIDRGKAYEGGRPREDLTKH